MQLAFWRWHSSTRFVQLITVGNLAWYLYIYIFKGIKPYHFYTVLQTDFLLYSENSFMALPIDWQFDHFTISDSHSSDYLIKSPCCANKITHSSPHLFEGTFRKVYLVILG